MGQTYVLDQVLWWNLDPQNLDHALTLAQQALALDDSLSGTHGLLSAVYPGKRQFDQALVERERAVALAPNNAESYLQFAGLLGPIGRTEEAIVMVKKAIRLNPRHPTRYLLALGHAYHNAWKNEEAIATYRQFITLQPHALQPNAVGPYFGLTCSLSDMGREEEARATAAEILRLSPTFTLDFWRKAQLYKDPAEAERHFNNLRKAGLK